MILTIDIGNTRTKVGLFKNNELSQTWNVASLDLKESLFSIMAEIPPKDISLGWMSVAQEELFPENALLKHFPQIKKSYQIHSTSDFPVENLYSTPETLGVDRIVAAIGAWSRSPKEPVLVIDIGTAMTFDIINEKSQYLGGGISLGVNMRFKALHEFTARLPLVAPVPNPALIGDSTVSSMLSGVINGTLAEINGVINEYRATFGPSLNVYLTGGDMKLFENHLKNVNFADSYLTLDGIHKVLIDKKLYE